MAIKVLVFESDAAFAGELRTELGKLGCTTHIVDDGNVGLQQAVSDRPDLILLSIELPRMNGFSVCNKLKKDPSLKDVPLIIMSSESSDETFEQHRKLRTRAEDYVHKPIAFGDLLARITPFVALQAPADEGYRSPQETSADEAEPDHPTGHPPAQHRCPHPCRGSPRHLRVRAMIDPRAAAVRQYALAYDRRALTYHNLRKYNEAIADYTVSIAKDPNNVTAYRKRADTYVAMGQFAQAVPDLEAALKLKPDDADIMQNLQFVRAKAAPPRVAAAPAAIATPSATPEPGLPNSTKIGIGVGALIILGIIIALISRRKTPDF